MFRLDNTDGFSQEELDEMNIKLETEIHSERYNYLPGDERVKVLSEEIMRDVAK